MIFFSRTFADLRPAWKAWEAGEIEQAHELAQEALDKQPSDAARHLLFLTDFVRGAYRNALGHYQAIGRSYRRLAELSELVINTYIHLGAVVDAATFARGRKDVSPITVQRLDEHAQRPLRLDLDGVAVLPFTTDELSAYLPGVSAVINDWPVTARLDTGGTFLLMGPARAAALGIRTIAAGADRAHLDLRRVDAAYGIADRLVLGDVVLHHVPVDVLSTLSGDNDVVIIGTNILERFLATIDYAHHRLLLSKREDRAAHAVHRRMLPVASTLVPFFLWDDHYMFARGGLGDRHDLNFFVDSGLVSLHSDGRGGVRQASFTSSKRRLREMGVTAALMRPGVFELPGTLSLGPLREERPLVVLGAAGDQCFGGVRIDGLISHAFLERYVWTIDFDARQFRFGHVNEAPD